MRVPLKITPDAYMKALAAAEDEEHVHVTAIAEIQGTPEKLTKEAALSFEYPPIQVQVRQQTQGSAGIRVSALLESRAKVPKLQGKCDETGQQFQEAPMSPPMTPMQTGLLGLHQLHCMGAPKSRGLCRKHPALAERTSSSSGVLNTSFPLLSDARNSKIEQGLHLRLHLQEQAERAPG